MNDSGKVPFAIIGVLIVLFAGFSTIYIAALNNQYFLNSNKRTEMLKDVLAAEEEKIKYLGEQAVLNALKNDVTHSSLIWKISQDAYRNFTELIAPYAPPNGMPTQGGYNIIIRNPIMTVSPIPFEYEDYNSLGMKARLRSHLYFKSIGSAELLVTDLETNTRLNATISLDSLVPSTRIFLMEQILKFQKEASGDSTVGSDVAEMVEYMLRQRAKSDDAKIMTTDLIKAVNFAAFLEEIKLFHDYDEAAAANLETVHNINFSDYISTHSLVDPAEIYPGVGKGDGSILIDVSSYKQPFEFYGVKSNMGDTTRIIQVDQNGALLQIIWDQLDYYTRFERKYDDKKPHIYVYDFDIKTGSMPMTVSSNDVLSAKLTTSFSTEMQLDLNIRFKDEYNEHSSDGDGVRILSTEYEGAVKEYGNYLREKGSVKLEIANLSHVPLEFSGCFADIYMNGEFLGSFTSSPVLPNIQEGNHEIRVELNYPDGGSEFEYVSFNMTPEGILESPLNNILDLEASYEGPDSIQFWELMALALRNLPLEKKLITAVEWVSSIVGYPFPSEVDNIYENSDRSTFVDYLGKFSQYIETLPDIWDPSFSNFLDVAEMTVDFAQETLVMVEEIVNEGLNVGEIILNIGEDYIELKLKDPVQKAVAKLVLRFLENKVSNLTFSIKDQVLKTKILKNLKNIGDALALISLTITAFRTIDKVVKIFTGEDEVSYKDLVNITFEFAEIALKFWVTAVNFAKNLGKETLAKLSIRIQRISLAVLIIYMFVSELIKNNGDILKTLESLFLGFDELTITWYSTIVSMVALKGISAIFSSAVATGIGIIIGVVAAIILIILSWDEFMAWITHSLSHKQVKELEDSIESSLLDTLSLAGKLNDMKSLSHASQAQSYYNLYSEMLRRSYFAKDEAESKKFLNLSKYAFDFYKAYRGVDASTVQARSALNLFWYIANDFDNTYYPHGGNTATASILINSNAKCNPELYEFLSSITEEEVKTTDVQYIIHSYPNLDAHKEWQGDLDNVSKFLSSSIEKFQSSMSSLKFLSVFPDPTEYSRDFGAIIIDYESRSGLSSLDMKVSSTTGKFLYAHNGAWYVGDSFYKHVMADKEGNLSSTVLIVKPGSYSIGVSNADIDIKSSSAIVDVTSGRSANFYVEVDKAFSYTLNSTYDGYVIVRIYRNGICEYEHQFSSANTKILSVPTKTQEYRLEISWDTDGNITNGTEVFKSHIWYESKLSEYATAYSKGFSLEVRIGDPKDSNYVEDLWT